MNSTQATFCWNGQTYHIISQTEKLNKPALRIIMLQPAFKHVSNLYHVTDTDTDRYLFDTDGYYYELNMSGQTAEVKPFTVGQYLILKQGWKLQQEARFASQILIASTDRK